MTLPVELERVLSLPRRQPSSWEPPRRPYGDLQLRPVQAEALGEIRAVGAGLVSAGVGHGKTLIGVLSGAALDVERVVYLAPAACVKQVIRTVQHAAQTWVFPPVYVLSWSRMSLPLWEEELTTAAGRGTFALVCDEAHLLRGESARTRRWVRFRTENAARSRVVLMSGTLTRRNLLDLVQIAWVALGSRSPVPIGSTASALAAYIEDPAMGRGHREAAALRKWAGVDDTVAALGERVRSAPGVVSTASQAVDLPIYCSAIESMPCAAPLLKLVDEVAATFRVPDGEDLITAADVARVQRQLALGYHLIWTWKNGPDREWIEARREWAAQVRRYIAANPDCDTELAVLWAVRHESTTPALVEAHRAWAAVNTDERAPIAKPHWHTTEVVDRLVDVAAQQRRCLLWYDEVAVVPLLKQLGVRVAPLGEAPTVADGVTAVSIRSHATGLDLQAWSRNVLLTCPSSGATWEQLLGRTHRAGQLADEVLVWRPAYCAVLNRAWRQAQVDASYIAKVSGQVQKLQQVEEVEYVVSF